MSQLTNNVTTPGNVVVQTLTGNSGGAVPPAGGNINIVGIGNVLVTGDIADNTLTISSGGVVLAPVRLATTGANLNATYNNGVAGVGATLTNAGAQAALVIDSVTVNLNDRILVKNQTTQADNGIYTVTTVGTGSTNWVLTRSSDFDTPAQIIAGSTVSVTAGTINAATIWIETATVTTVGTDPIVFISFTNSGIAEIAGDTGTAVGNIVTIAGGNNITTAASGSILTVNVSGTTQHNVQIGSAAGALSSVSPSTAGFVLTSNGASSDPSFQVVSASGALTTADGDTGSATPSSGVITWHGGSNISTSATGSTVTVNLVNSPSVSGSVTAATGLTATAGGITATGTSAINATGTASTTIGNTGSGSALDLYAGTGNFILDGAAGTTMSIGPSLTTGTITIGGASQTGAIDIGLGTSAASTVNIATGNHANQVVIGTYTGAAATSILSGTGDLILDSSASGTIIIGPGLIGGNIDMGINMTNGSINIGSTSQVSGISIGYSSSAQTISLGTGTGNTTLDIGTNSGTNAINIGGSSSTTTIVGGFVTPAFKFTASPSNGYVLKSDASGNASWEAESSSGAITSAVTDSGTATPSAGAVTWHGGSNISTSGATDIVTINLVNSPSVSGSLTAGTGVTATTGGLTATAGGLTVTAGGAAITGTTNINTTGSAATNLGDSSTTGYLTLNTGGAMFDSAGSGAVNLGTGTTGVVTIGNISNGGDITFGSGGMSMTGTTYINNLAGTAATTIGNTTGSLTLIGTTFINNSQSNNTTINGGSSSGTVAIGNSAATVNVLGAVNINTTGSASTAIGDASGASSITERVGTGGYSLDGVGGSSYTFGSSTTTGTMTIGGASQTGLLSLGSSTGTNIVGVGTGSGATTVDIATGATNAKTVNIATANLASAINIGAASTTTTITGGIITAGLTGILIGNGASAVTAQTVTQYDVLVGGASNAISSVAPGGTSGVPLISQGSSSNPAFGTAVVAGGGTGSTSFTAYSVLCGGTTSTGALQNVSGVGTSGQVLTSQGASSLPHWASASSGITTIDGDSGSVTGSTVTITGGTTGAVFTGASSTLTMSFAGITANAGIVNLGTDNTTNAINISTGASARTVDVGYNPGSSSGNGSTINIIGGAAGGTGTGYVAINNSVTAPYTYVGSADQGIVNIQGATVDVCNFSLGNVNIATGAYANTVTIGSTTASAATNIYSGSGGMNISCGANTNTLNINSSTGSTTLGNTGAIISISGYGIELANGINGISCTTLPSTTGTALVLDSGNVIATLASSSKYKDNIQPVGEYSDKLLKLRPVTFNYKRDPQILCAGLVAEEVAQVMPEIVQFKNGEADSVRYHEMTALLIDQIQKLVKRVENLEFLLEINNIKGH